MSSRAAAVPSVAGAAPKLAGLMILIGFVVALLVPATASRAAAQEDDEADPALLLIMDSSGSMNASDGGGGTKIQAAKEALNGVVNALPSDSLVGLRVYGHRIPNTDERRGCRDTELISPVGPLDRSGMRQQIRSFDAKGFTPIGLSLQKGARDLPSEGERTIHAPGLTSGPPNLHRSEGGPNQSKPGIYGGSWYLPALGPHSGSIFVGPGA